MAKSITTSKYKKLSLARFASYWASWHVQNGTTLQELQQLGGWANFNMVLRYAHLSSEHLKTAASRLPSTISLHSNGLDGIELRKIRCN